MTSWTLACAPFAQGDVGEDFGGAAEDGRVAVDRGVAGAQADVVRAELAAQRQPLLVDQRLDGAGVNRALALGDGLEMQRRGHQRFARAGGRVEDDVLLLEQLQDGRFLRRIEPQPLALGVFEKAPQQHIVARVLVPGHQIVECQWHGAGIIGESLLDGRVFAADVGNHGSGQCLRFLVGRKSPQSKEIECGCVTGESARKRGAFWTAPVPSGAFDTLQHILSLLAQHTSRNTASNRASHRRRTSVYSDHDDGM